MAWCSSCCASLGVQPSSAQAFLLCEECAPQEQWTIDLTDKAELVGAATADPLSRPVAEVGARAEG